MLDGLLGGVELRRFPQGVDTPIAPLSGGERRRIALARTLLDNPELLLLDEPTNHLDVEGVDWLAHHLAARRGTLLVVTHDRWFLDAVCTATWEVADGDVHQYEGGYAAYVLARAERDRIAAVREERRQGLLRKELAWLRRGPPARTSKPRFRIEAAEALIADEPEARDRAELLRFASSRLGDRVLDAVDVSVAYDGLAVLERATWRLGPGDRVALVGVNGAGKTTLIRLLEGTLAPDAGEVERGSTVRVALLSQDTAEIPGHLRVLESLEAVRGRSTLSDGREITAGLLADRFGFRGEKGRTLVRDLSGGERRRLQLMRLLMDGPNVLLLDEPTNDLDIDTLRALEDLLDGWPGTLVVISHDRYFVERVCDDVYGLMGDGGVRHLPGGIEQYLELRRAAAELEAPPARAARAHRGPGRRRAARRPQGGRAARARAREALRPRAGAARRHGRRRHRPRAAARAPGRARYRRGRAGSDRGRVAGRGGDRGGRPMTDMQALEPLVGAWTVEVVHPDLDGAVRGELTAEWLDGGGYLIRRTAMEDPAFPRSISVIGPERGGGRVVQHYFDSRGVARIYEIALADGVLTLSRDDEDMAQRFTGRLSDDGSVIDGAWERTDDDGAWIHDFKQTERRKG